MGDASAGEPHHRMMTVEEKNGIKTVSEWRQTMITAYNYPLQTVKRDGHCLFWALAQGIQRENWKLMDEKKRTDFMFDMRENSVRDILLYWNDVTAADLRSEWLPRYRTKYQNHFKKFTNYPGNSREILEILKTEPSYIQDGPLKEVYEDAYLGDSGRGNALTQTSPEYGEEIHIVSIAKLYELTIHVDKISPKDDGYQLTASEYGIGEGKTFDITSHKSIILLQEEPDPGKEPHFDMWDLTFVPGNSQPRKKKGETRVTPGEEDQKEIAAKKAAKEADAAARKAAAAKKKEEKEEERKAKAANTPVQPNYKPVLDFFKKSCHDFNKMQCKFNLEVLMKLPNETNSDSDGYDLWEEILAKTENSERLKKQIYDNIAQYGQDIDQGKVESKILVKSEFGEATLFSDNLLQWMQSSRLDRERFAWHLFDPKYQENVTDNENKKVDTVVEELKKNKSKENEEIWRKYLRILHSAVAKFHSNMAFAINYYVQNAVSISANLEETERNQRIDIRRQIFKEFGLHLYPACLPEKIQSNFKNWAEHAINLALSGKKYKIPKGLYNDHEAIAVFKSLVDITVEHLRRSSRGDAGWVSRTVNGDGRPKTSFDKDPVRWGAQITTNNHFLVDPNVPAPVLNTALKGSRRWLISENVNW